MLPTPNFWEVVYLIVRIASVMLKTALRNTSHDQKYVENLFYLMTLTPIHSKVWHLGVYILIAILCIPLLGYPYISLCLVPLDIIITLLKCNIVSAVYMPKGDILYALWKEKSWEYTPYLWNHFRWSVLFVRHTKQKCKIITAFKYSICHCSDKQVVPPQTHVIGWTKCCFCTSQAIETDCDSGSTTEITHFTFKPVGSW